MKIKQYQSLMKMDKIDGILRRIGRGYMRVIALSLDIPRTKTLT